MQLILLRNIERLGAVGDTVKVKDGYARNWLLPQKFALEATAENLNRLEHKKRKLLALEKENVQKFKALGAEISKQSVTIRARANKDDHLFGSVAARDIVDAFATENIALEPKMILLDEPIKELGRYSVKIRLHPDVEVTSKIWVVAEDSKEIDIDDEVKVENAPDKKSGDDNSDQIEENTEISEISEISEKTEE